MMSDNLNDLTRIAEFLKHAKFLMLSNDVIFKAYFKSHKQLLTSVLMHFLPLPKGSRIISIEVLDPDLSPVKLSKIKEESGKQFVLDLRVKFERITEYKEKQIEIVNVEMQTTSEPYFTDRILAYSARLYSEQLKRGLGYSKLSPVYSLVFTTKNLKVFKSVQDYYHVCNIRRTEPPEVLMSNGLCFVIVELGKFDKRLHKLYNVRESWCYLLKNSRQLSQVEYTSFREQGGDMAKAVKHLWNLSQDESLREYLDAIEKRRMDKISREQWIHGEGRKEGLKTGREEGLKTGREEGLKTGREEGLKTGREEGLKTGREEVALNMLKSGIDLQVILDSTKLSKQEILKLQKKTLK